MTDDPVTFVSLTVAAVSIPAAAKSAAAPGTHLIGAGLFIATRDSSHWRFSSEAAIIAAGEKEQNLLLWLADRLPLADTLIGWQIDHRLVPALLDAAAHADATIAHHFTLRLARALRHNVVDLAIDRGGAAASALWEVAGEAAIASPSMTANALLGNWSVGRLDLLRADFGAEALAIWLLFLRQAQTMGLDAEDETLAWMRRRSSIHLMKSEPRALGAERREIGIREERKK
ncbi:hypothetical protein Sphch_3033 [Sphingobium chlorophenolicum L-1]|uniref:Uncharacterized protein n=1 Tax=Sphingobium chlorophenolicum L-1 TaxID=690566 RepID=F6F2J5_SPHCR|nr:hypothetical protein [Sphingobium chlorophenolicum]AEG50657.1 hypothetical protein Sphch_3033 [Sphingobium chlorophenolicum L-1]